MTLLDIVLFPCDQCAKKYQSSYSLKRHMDIHSGNKPFKCDICEKAFVYKSYPLDHLKTHSSLEDCSYLCEICGQTFKLR